jgi:acyl carrier protein
MTNLEKLKNLVMDVFLIEPGEFRMDLRRDQVETWDSLGVVSLAVGLQETFGYHLTQDEALSVTSVSDVARILTRHGISFDAA